MFSEISFFYLKVLYFRLIMENNFIQMAVSAGHVVAYTIGPFFKHIIDYLQLYFTNGLTNILWTKIRSIWPDKDRHWCVRGLLAHFRSKMDQLCLWTKILTKQWLVLGASAFQCMRAGFLCPKCDNFICLHTHTYIHNWSLQSFRQDYWASFSHHLCCVC